MRGPDWSRCIPSATAVLALIVVVYYAHLGVVDGALLAVGLYWVGSRLRSLVPRRRSGRGDTNTPGP